jgi:mono/diheme cytochrome c family protein
VGVGDGKVCPGLDRRPEVGFDSAVTEVAAPAPADPARSARWLAAPIFAFALVSLAAGVLADHNPRAKGYFRLFFSDPVHLKAGFASAAVALACFQLFSAAWIFRKLPWPRPRWIGRAHRWSGRLAFAFTLPVAYHCIFKLGFQTPDARVITHSLLGCFVYGAFAAKVTILRLHRFPRFVLPIAGGLLFSTLVAVWATSALWLYRHSTNVAPAYAAPTPIPASASPVRGAVVFKSAGCSGCHTLAAAGATGQVGPNLDKAPPGYAKVVAQVEKGGGVMPSFKGKLTPAQISDVAAFVASRAGSRHGAG